MRKKIKVWTVLIISIILLVACNGEDNDLLEEEYDQVEITKAIQDEEEILEDEENEGIEEIDIEAIAIDEEYPEEEQTYIYDINDASLSQWGNFGEGLAWVRYRNSENETYKWIAVDKDGIAQTFIEGERTISPERFNNGYTHFVGDNGSHYKVVDIQGNITHYTGDRNVLAYGQGYTVVLDHVGGFDEAYYTYTIYDPYGSEISYTQWENDRIEVNFGGNKVFNFMMSNTLWLFNIQTEEWHNTEYSTYAGDKRSVYFYDDWAVLTLRVVDPDRHGGCAILMLANINGETRNIMLPFYEMLDEIKSCVMSVTYDSPHLKNNIFVESNSANLLLSYDIETETIRTIDEYWAERFDRSGNLTFGNELITAHFRGEDGLSYLATFDKEWNIIIEPILSREFWGFEYERLIVRTMRNDNYLGLVLNENGEEVFTFDIQNENTGWRDITSYIEETLRVIDDNNVRYYDLEGNVLFDEVDISITHEEV